MKSYVIADRSTENTNYYAGLNGWVSLPENAIWFESEKQAKNASTNEKLIIEEIED